ncbi:MAG TPA: hypothetical protein VHE56_13320 [Mycobacteriales bacterium]|nr:hypothetical protein [Mycobacteriales bacterium]
MTEAANNRPPRLGRRQAAAAPLRPVARRPLLAASLVALMLLATPVASAVSTASRHVGVGSQLVSYMAIANAPGVGIDGIYMGVSLDVPQVRSTLTTGGVGAGLASIAWPGDIGGNGGDALLILEPSVPTPIAKLLNDPIKAESHSTGTRHAINKSLPGTVMQSSASHSLVTASSQTQAAVPALGSLGAFSGSSSAKLIGPHSIRAVSQSATTDLSLANGAIRIGSLVSRAVVVSNGKATHGHASTTVADVTIAGIPVTIDHDGIHLAKSVIPTAAVTKLLSTTLAALHLHTTFTKTLVTRDQGFASYDAGALVLTYHPNASTYSITLGRASAQVNASPSLLTDFGTPPASSTGTPSTASGGSAGGSDGLPSGDSAGIPPSDSQPPSIAGRIVNATKSLALAGGPTGLMVFALVCAVIASALLLPRIAGRFLAAPADADCEEDA